MGWIDNIAGVFGGGQRADTQPVPEDDYWYTPTARESSSGIKVTADTALKASSLHACIKILAETMASLPLQMSKFLPDGSTTPAPEHPIDSIIRYQANNIQTAVEFWETMMLHAALRGNAYAEIVPGPRGPVDQLKPLRNVTTTILRDGTLRFKAVDHFTRETRVFLQEEVFRIPGLSSDGVSGLSAVDLAADDIGVGLAADEYAARVFKNKLNIGGFLVHAGKLTLSAQRRLIARLTERYAGADNFHRPLVLQGGWRFEKATMDAAQAQLLEARKWQITVIAQRFRIPMHMLCIDDLTNRSTVEEQSINFVKYTIRPWARRIEQAIRRDLIIAQRLYEAKFNLDALERGNTEARGNFWTKALGSGGQGAWMTQNEVRKAEGLPPRPEKWADELPQGTNPAAAPTNQQSSDSQPANDNKAAALLQTAKTLVRKEVAALRRLSVRHADNQEAFRKAVNAFYAGFASEWAAKLGLTKAASREWCRNRAARVGGANDISSAIDAIEDDGDDVLKKLGDPNG